MKRERGLVGRPRASSRDTIEDAAAELFLEQSYLGTTIDEISQRAGVSRATFFNYFGSKSDLLWIDADQAIEQLSQSLGAGATVVDAILVVASTVDPQRVPLAVTQANVMGTHDELVASGLARVARLTALIRDGLARESGDPRHGLALNVRANALAGAVIAAWGSWISDGVHRGPLADYIHNALALVQLE
jgi:AcrR family transcriptional regulator